MQEVETLSCRKLWQKYNNSKCYFNNFRIFLFFVICRFHLFVVVCLFVDLFVFAILYVRLFFLSWEECQGNVGATIWLSFIRLNRRQNIFDIPQLHIYTHIQTNGVREREIEKNKEHTEWAVIAIMTVFPS